MSKKKETAQPTYARFEPHMKKDYTILLPTMLPMHFSMMEGVFRANGYNTVLLENTGQAVIEKGLKYVHNDTCYPAQLVIGQFLDAIKSGKYDTSKLALVITQTGGGCRASNYIFLLRKALERAGYGHIPVLSLNFSGLEKGNSLELSIGTLRRLVAAVLYGDLLMHLVNQCRPYEKNAGDTQRMADKWTAYLRNELHHSRLYKDRDMQPVYRRIIRDFASIEVERRPVVRVGIVGEIFVKFSPLGNNDLEKFLIHEGAEPVVPDFVGFCLYCIYNSVIDHELYKTGWIKAKGAGIIYRYLVRRQHRMIDAVREEGSFAAPTPFDVTMSSLKGMISNGMKMGEGWLLTAEMIELIEHGVKNIVCTQPFGCLPNHIAGKGMMKPLKEKYPDVNIVAIDYDAGATRVNQENRIKLMLANAVPVAFRGMHEEKADHGADRDGGTKPPAINVQTEKQSGEREKELAGV